MNLNRGVTLGYIHTAKKSPPKGTQAAFKDSPGDSEALFAPWLLGKSRRGFRRDPSPGGEGGAWEDPQPHSCQRPENLPGTEEDGPEYGPQFPPPYPPGRTALVERKGEGKWSPLDRSTIGLGHYGVWTV